jgi:hypothetical protein
VLAVYLGAGSNAELTQNATIEVQEHIRVRSVHGPLGKERVEVTTDYT